MKTALVFTAVVSITLYAAAQQQHFDGRALWRHVEVLAADDMEGRGIAEVPATVACGRK